MRRRSAFPPIGDRRGNYRGSPVTAPARSPLRPLVDNTDFAHDSFTRGRNTESLHNTIWEEKCVV